MSQPSSSDVLRLKLLALVERALGLLTGLGLDYSQPVTLPEQAQTEEEAQRAGIHAAVKALGIVLLSLIGPRATPTMDEGEQALDAIRQRRSALEQRQRIENAFYLAFRQTLTEFCRQLEAILDEEELRKNQPPK